MTLLRMCMHVQYVAVLFAHLGLTDCQLTFSWVQSPSCSGSRSKAQQCCRCVLRLCSMHAVWCGQTLACTVHHVSWSRRRRCSACCTCQQHSSLHCPGYVMRHDTLALDSLMHTGESVSAPSPLAAKRWHHVAITVSADSTLTLYIDGLCLFVSCG